MRAKKIHVVLNNGGGVLVVELEPLAYHFRLVVLALHQRITRHVILPLHTQLPPLFWLHSKYHNDTPRLRFVPVFENGSFFCTKWLKLCLFSILPGGKKGNYSNLASGFDENE